MHAAPVGARHAGDVLAPPPHRGARGDSARRVPRLPPIIAGTIARMAGSYTGSTRPSPGVHHRGNHRPRGGLLDERPGHPAAAPKPCKCETFSFRIPAVDGASA